ncbi:hypothetical protein [Lactobacillus selangorensis]|nr:hypothetical protein [Lactobacillus selangorensis]
MKDLEQQIQRLGLVPLLTHLQVRLSKVVPASSDDAGQTPYWYVHAGQFIRQTDWQADPQQVLAQLAAIDSLTAAETPTILSEKGAQLQIGWQLPAALLVPLFTQVYHKEFNDDYIAFSNAVYLQLDQNLTRLRYALSYWLGASRNGRSVLNRKTAQFADAATLQTALRVGADAPVRLVGTHADLAKHGIDGLVIQRLDLDPFTTDGISLTTLHFLKLWAIFCLLLPLPKDINKQLHLAEQFNQKVASEQPNATTQAQKSLLQLVQNLQQLAVHLQLNPTVLDLYAAAVKDPKLTKSARLAATPDFVAQQQQWVAIEQKGHPEQLRGYLDFSPASQAVLTTAYQQGLQIGNVDAGADLIQIKRGTHSTWLQQGTVTAKTPLVAAKVVADRQVVKQQLAQAGLNVPAGHVYTSWADAQNDFNTSFGQKALVVKPKQGCGGVTAFTRPTSLAVFQAAFEKAQQVNRQVLVESFVAGTSYRFLVIGTHVASVLERVAANVVGDGRTTIADLITHKNGTLQEKALQLDDRAQQVLATQGYSAATILPRGTQAWLQHETDLRNERLEVSADMDATYQELAVAIARQFHLGVAGVDLIIPNLYLAYQPDQPQLATVLGLHAAPDLMPHLQPTFGDKRPVTTKLLQYVL